MSGSRLLAEPSHQGSDPSNRAVGSTPEGTGVGSILFVPDWRERPAPGEEPQSSALDAQVLLVDGDVPLRRLLDDCGIHHQEVDVAGAYRVLRDAMADKQIQRLVLVHTGQSASLRALAALARTARAERPRLRVSSVEVGEGVGADLIAGEVRDGLDDPEVRLTDGRREVLEWSEFTPAPLTRFQVSLNATYLITGGLGGLGRHFAELLADRGAGKIVLTGRSAPDGEAHVWMQSLRCLVEYRAADVSNRQSVRDLITDLRMPGSPPLKGVLHAAGVLRDGLLLDKDKDDSAWNQVCAPKVTGTVVLDEETSDVELDWFVCFSSVAGAVGNPGQAEYAYANRFMDGYMSDREKLRISGRRHGRSLAIGWPLWADGGMGLDEATIARLERTVGTLPLGTDVGQQVFEALMSGGPAWVGVLHGHRRVITEAMRMSSSENERGSEAHDITADIESQLIDICADILKYPRGELDPDENIRDCGLDSIGLMSLMNRVEEAFSVTVEPSAFSEYTTLGEMAYHLEGLGVKSLPPVSTSTELASTPEELPEPVLPATPAARSDADRIAVIGMAVRLPGSPTVEDFWEHLESGDCLIREMPHERFDTDRLFSSDKTTPGRTYSKHGGFLDDDIFAFDAQWFGIGDEDAMVMDPHHRIMLELSVELLHDAGYRPGELAGSRTGVYLGGGESNYLKGKLSELSTSMMRRAVVNTIPNMAAARVSDFLDLKGPSQMVDTACSSALVGVHQACAGLRSGDCETAIVGGVELLTDGQVHIGFSKADVLSTEGICRVFDADADGMIPGEGAGLLLLKPYEAAIEDGDNIHAIILGSAVNNDGHTIGLTVPGSQGQQDVLSHALSAAGVHASDITYLEAHGTGTSLGDPIEIQAASRVYVADGAGRQQCGVGSVKSNIGHLMRAAGAASIIKVILSLSHGKIPPTLNCTHPHPRFRFSESPFFPVRELTDWPDDPAHPRRAAVSAFGFGGTNAHVLLEAADSTSPGRRPLPRPTFNRKHYKVGDPIVPLGRAAISANDPSSSPLAGDVAAILDQIEAGLLSPAAAADLLRTGTAVNGEQRDAQEHA